MKLKAKHSAVIALILANIIWGATSPIMKWALTDIHPLSLAFFRFSFATLVLLPFALKKLHFDPKDIYKLIGMAFFGFTINIGLFYIALTSTESINAPLIGSAAPIFVVIISIFFLHEKTKLKTIAGSILGLLGVLIVLIQPILEKGIDGSFNGNVLLILATLASIVHLFISKSLGKKYQPITIAFYSFLLASLSFIPFFLSDMHAYGLPPLSLPTVGGILYGAVFSSGLAYYFYYYAEEFLMPSEVSLFNYIPPIVAIIIALPLLGESLTTMYLLGALLVFMGVYIAEADFHYHPFHHGK